MNNFRAITEDILNINEDIINDIYADILEAAKNNYNNVVDNAINTSKYWKFPSESHILKDR